MSYVDCIINRNQSGPPFSAIGPCSVLVHNLTHGKIQVQVKFRHSDVGHIGWLDCPVVEITEDSMVLLSFPEDQVLVRAVGTQNNNDGVYVRFSHI